MNTLQLRNRTVQRSILDEPVPDGLHQTLLDSNDTIQHFPSNPLQSATPGGYSEGWRVEEEGNSRPETERTRDFPCQTSNRSYNANPDQRITQPSEPEWAPLNNNPTSKGHEVKGNGQVLPNQVPQPIPTRHFQFHLPPIPKPSVYNGQEEFNIFVARVDNYISSFITESDMVKIRTMAAFLGPAFMTYQAWLGHQCALHGCPIGTPIDQLSQATYPSLIQFLSSRHGCQKSLTMVRRELRTRTRAEHESLEHYLTQLQNLAIQAYPEDGFSQLIQEQILDQFIIGVNDPAITEHLSNLPILTSPEQALRIAQQLLETRRLLQTSNFSTVGAKNQAQQIGKPKALYVNSLHGQVPIESQPMEPKTMRSQNYANTTNGPIAQPLIPNPVSMPSGSCLANSQNNSLPISQPEIIRGNHHYHQSIGHQTHPSGYQSQPVYHQQPPNRHQPNRYQPNVQSQRQQQACFACGQVGHIQRFCPQKNKQQQGPNAKPAGLGARFQQRQ